jgi:hypothetical protein
MLCEKEDEALTNATRCAEYACCRNSLAVFNTRGDKHQCSENGDYNGGIYVSKVGKRLSLESGQVGLTDRSA